MVGTELEGLLVPETDFSSKQPDISWHPPVTVQVVSWLSGHLHFEMDSCYHSHTQMAVCTVHTAS